MNGSAIKSSEDADVVERGSAPAGMRAKMRQPRSRAHMHIRMMLAHTHVRFILVDHSSLAQPLFDAGFDLGEGLGTGAYPPEQTSRRHLQTKDLA
nr:hypothetical protein [Ktedonosporobacter rubrisoli]